jgi:hypothetical protein
MCFCIEKSSRFAQEPAVAGDEQTLHCFSHRAELGMLYFIVSKASKLLLGVIIHTLLILYTVHRYHVTTTDAEFVEVSGHNVVY